MAALRLVRGGVGRSGRWLTLALGAFALLAAGPFAAATVADRETTLEQGWTDVANADARVAEGADRALRVAEITTARVAELAAREGLDRLGGEA